MLRVAALLAGAAALAVLIGAAVQRAAPRIEADVAARASVALLGAGIDWARVAADGRTLTLSGAAPDASGRAAAISAVTELPGVKAVNAAFGRQPAAATAQTTELSIAIGDGEIRVQGTVSDTDAAERLAAGIRSAFPETPLAEHLDIALAPPEHVTLAVGLLPSLALLDSGRVTIGDKAARLEGRAPGPSGRDRATDSFNDALPAGMTGEVAIEVPAPSQSAGTCQTALDRILSDPVVFTPDEAAISPASHDLLDQVARVIIACPGLDIMVGAHTDSGGNESDNLALTQRRADEILRHLVGDGVPAGRLTARGYGSSQPQASNDNQSGRRANRRIEIIVKNPET